MAGVHKKGRVGEDGVTRYYDPHKKLWVTEKQIHDEQGVIPPESKGLRK
ncbi:MAG: hypothetical protein RIR04_682 [Pseudomonadota bacterium]